ncbi:MAG TPA: glycerol acyltransferase, partial [Marmoricola sp.]|nr:glycerol acyltransferase [Marmoricola sp.]
MNDDVQATDADSNVIPLGTRGRPGRGTGSANPSASARNLALPLKDGRVKPFSDPKSAKRTLNLQAPVEFEEAAATREVTTTEPRPLAAGIPVGDWLNALMSAAREVFGHNYEAKLAELLAFLRR